MDEILARLSAADRVLDLGGGSGSLPPGTPAKQVVLDLARPAVRPAAPFVQADAAALPFRSGVFHAVIANHSLEHFVGLDACLAEIGRVARSDARAFISVPDSMTLADRLYRWLGRGGGHVNPFPDARRTAQHIARGTALEHRATRLLHTGYSILNAKTFTGRGPRKLWLLGGGSETFVRWLTLGFRLLDRALGTRLSVYGWAFYFGPPIEVDVAPRPNVCIRCGAGADATWLRSQGRSTRSSILRLERYRCPSCGALNFLT